MSRQSRSRQQVQESEGILADLLDSSADEVDEAERPCLQADPITHSRRGARARHIQNSEDTLAVLMESSEDEDDRAQPHKCQYCNIPFESHRGLMIHQGLCRYRYSVPPEQLEAEPNFGGDDNGYDAEVEMDGSNRGASYETITQSRTSLEVATLRNLPREEAYGYQIDATFSREPLTSLAARVLRQERQRRANKSSTEDVDDDVAEDVCTGMIAEDILLSDSDDSDYSVASANIESFDQINVDGGDSQIQSMYDISDEWEHCRHIEDISHLDVHILPDPLDPKEMPQIYVAMLDLMDRTSGCPDLGLFDKIMEWAIHFSIKFP